MESSETQPSQLGEAAVGYAARGWRVLPLAPGGKKPLNAGGHLGASGDPGQLRQWWARWPDANIGAVVPDGLLVVDIDPRNGGSDTARWLTERFGALPATLTARTGSLGWHLWFRNRLDPEVMRGSLGPGLDVKKPGRGYVVMPPSRTAHEYRWVSMRQVAWLPIEWERRVRQPPRPRPQRVTDPARAEAEIWQAVAWMRGASRGDRNPTLYRQAANLAERGCLTAEAERRLADAAAETGLGPQEVHKTITSARSRFA